MDRRQLASPSRNKPFTRDVSTSYILTPISQQEPNQSSVHVPVSFTPRTSTATLSGGYARSTSGFTPTWPSFQSAVSPFSSLSLAPIENSRAEVGPSLDRTTTPNTASLKKSGMASTAGLMSDMRTDMYIPAKEQPTFASGEVSSNPSTHTTTRNLSATEVSSSFSTQVITKKLSTTGVPSSFSTYVTTKALSATGISNITNTETGPPTSGRENTALEFKSNANVLGSERGRPITSTRSLGSKKDTSVPVTDRRSTPLRTQNILFDTNTQLPISGQSTHSTSVPGVAESTKISPSPTSWNLPSVTSANVLASTSSQNHETREPSFTHDTRTIGSTANAEGSRAFLSGTTTAEPIAATTYKVSNNPTALGSTHVQTPVLATERTERFPTSTSVNEAGSAQSHGFGSGAVGATVGSIAAGGLLFVILFAALRWMNKKNRSTNPGDNSPSVYDPDHPYPLILMENIRRNNNPRYDMNHNRSAGPQRAFGSFQ